MSGVSGEGHGLVRETDHLGPGGGIDEDFLRAAEAPDVDLLLALGGVDENLLPPGAGFVAGLDMDFLLVLPRLPAHELAAQIGDLDPGLLVFDVRVDVELVSVLGVLGPPAARIAGLNVALHAAFHVENLPGPVVVMNAAAGQERIQATDKSGSVILMDAVMGNIVIRSTNKVLINP